MGNEDKVGLDAMACRAFLYKGSLKLKSRYLLFKLVVSGVMGRRYEVTFGGVQSLAAETGYSKGVLSRGLELLVDQGILVMGMESTRGRPKFIYSLDPLVRKALVSPLAGNALTPWLIRILKADELPFSGMSKSEVSLLAFLWGQVSHPMTCVLDGKGVYRLSKRAGVDRATFYELTTRLQEKGMLVPSGAAFTADGAISKTKTYFLLGPAALACWPKIFSWRFDLGPILEWFAGTSNSYSGKALMDIIEGRAPAICGEWLAVREQLPDLWSNPSDRYFVLMQCCAALSHAFSMSTSSLWGSNILYSQIESSLLKVFRLPLTGPGLSHTAIENFDGGKFAVGQWPLIRFLEQVSALLIDEMKSLFPVPIYLGELGPGMKFLSCYPIQHDTQQSMRIDIVFENRIAGDKFEACLPAEYKASGLVLPEQLQENSDL